MTNPFSGVIIGYKYTPGTKLSLPGFVVYMGYVVRLDEGPITDDDKIVLSLAGVDITRPLYSSNRTYAPTGFAASLFFSS